MAAAQSWSGAPEGEVSTAIVDVPLEFETLFAPELARALPPVPWVCQGLTIAPGRPTIICGIGGVGKSWFAQALMLAGACDVEFLGRFRCKPGMRSVYVDYEQGQYQTQQRFQLLAGAMGVKSLSALDRRIGYTWRPIPSWNVEPGKRNKACDSLCRYVDKLKLDLMIGDSVRACSPGTEENSSAASGPMDLATMVSAKTGVAIAFLDHSGKPGKDGQDRGVHNQRGHSSKTDACQTQLMLFANRGKPTLVSCRRGQLAAQPDWPEDFAFKLSVVNGGVALLPAAVEDCAEEDKRVRKDVTEELVLLLGAKPAHRANWYAERLETDPKTIRARLQSLEAEGIAIDDDGEWSLMP